MNDPVLFGENGLQQIYQQFFMHVHLYAVYSNRTNGLFLLQIVQLQSITICHSLIVIRKCCIAEPINWFLQILWRPTN